MIKTVFYTFIQTKYEEENADPTDVNNPLFPQEVEIRPITPFPWEIIKTLTIDELWTSGKFKLPLEQIRGTLLRHVTHDEMTWANFSVCTMNIVVKDLDTDTLHIVKLWKYQHEDYFALREDWIKEFVIRRKLVDGMVVGMYWDFEGNVLCFSVLEGSE